MKPLDRCPVCDHDQLYPIYAHKEVQKYNLEVLRSRDEALGVATGAIDFVCCGNCCFTFNRKFSPEGMEYDIEYESSRSMSKVFQDYLEQTAKEASERLGRGNQNVVEIGCGDGEFLALYKDSAPDAQCFGFDPSFRKAPHQGIDIKKAYYQADLWDGPIDAMIFRHILEHRRDPGGFLKELFGQVKSKWPERIFIEVPCWDWIVDNNQFYALSYEHCSYFSAQSMAVFFQKLGYALEDLSFKFNGEYLHAYGVRQDNPRPMEVADATLYSRSREFAKKLQASVDEMKRQFFTEGKKPILWGAAGKGTMLINMLEVTHDKMPYVIDSNADRDGTFIPRTGQEVILPHRLNGLDYEYKTVLLSNPLYRQEIEASLQKLGVDVNLESLL